MKNKRNRIGFFAIMLAAAMMLTACKGLEVNESYGIHTEAQSGYLADKYKNFKLYANGTEEMSRPEPIEIESDKSILLSEDADMSNAREYESSNGKVEIYNLMIGKTYYCSEKDSSKVSSFAVEAAAPRNLFVGGVTNVRDLGGWNTENGNVPQGLIYRSGKLSADETGETLISAEGIDTMVNTLGIRTELDLRSVSDGENGGLTESPLGNGVNYISVPLESGGNVILLNKDSLADVFAVFGNRENYPILFHCSIGTDRTGMVAFLINGLLGVGEEDLYRDFLFSNFGEIGSMRTPSIIKTYMQTVDMAAGSSMSEKIYNYLVGTGVDPADLDNLIEIMSDAK